MAALDTLRRPLESLRLSVTDRCNLRCAYCMPEEHYTWLPRNDLLSFEEIAQVVRAFCDEGVRHLRLTGGEPLLRSSLSTLVEMVRREDRLEDIALTTNGILLADQAADLRRAGLDRVTVSLDTLQPERFKQLTRRDGLEKVFAGLEAARSAGFTGTKLDTVVVRGTNDDELIDLLEFARTTGVELRFIEYMDVGGATRFDMEQVVSRREILERVVDRYGPLEPAPKRDRAPANRFRLPGGMTFGVIASTTDPFCRSCDRSRLTADGMWFLCLYAQTGIDLRSPLRAGASPEELRARIRGTWGEREDRGAEQRREERELKPFATPGELRADPHLEMHTRGG